MGVAVPIPKKEGWWHWVYPMENRYREPIFQPSNVHHPVPVVRIAGEAKGKVWAKLCYG